MGNKWKKLKQFLGLKTCVAVPEERDQCPDFRASLADRRETFSSSYAMSVPTASIHHSGPVSARPTPAPPLFHSGPIATTVRSNNVTSKSICSICLEAMKTGNGHALFTAECSHTFHFSCIASNVRFGNLICPVCRAKWKEVPWQATTEGSKGDRVRSGRRGLSAVARSLAYVGRSNDVPTPDHGYEQRRQYDLDLDLWRFHQDHLHHHSHATDPAIYDDDEPPPQLVRSSSSILHANAPPSRFECLDTSFVNGQPHMFEDQPNQRSLELTVLSEVSAISAMESRDDFLLLVHLKAPCASLNDRQSRAPVDLVTVLDVSGSMAGTKLTLLKEAMKFVVANLGPADRLSVVAFSSSARRIFPLRRMVDEGRQQALRAIDALVSSGGTNIAEGLRKGAKVFEDRRVKNPVAAIMLLSDGQDTYTMNSHQQHEFFVAQGASLSRRLVPGYIRNRARNGQLEIPVHTFGFGSDHDASTMHSISEASGGTFSFIQREGVMQDAFAQCIGGLLSVVAQDVQLTVSCCAPGVLINKVHAGSYGSSILENGRHGSVKLGDLYAEEERDILLEVKVPACSQPRNGEPMALLQAGCMYKDPVSQEVNQSIAEDLCIWRPEALDERQQVLCLQVDRQRNRFKVAEAIAKARSLADAGQLTVAQNHLQRAQDALSSSPSALCGDHLCSVLESELREIQARIANEQTYETTGRAYILSAQSSHLRQRATTRGESLNRQIHDYQTSSMVGLVSQSQTLASISLPSTSAAFPAGAGGGQQLPLSRIIPAKSSGSKNRKN